MTTVIGIVTARGGSKGIIRKNVRLLGGKPLVAWTIEAALASLKLSNVIMSTDDEEIADVSRLWGADVPFIRPSHLAQDMSSHIEVVVHALQWLAQYRGLLPEYVMLLQPTVPLRSPEDIDRAISLAEETGADSVISVCLAANHPYLCKKIGPDGQLQDFLYHIDQDLPRQHLPPAYALNGAIYLIKREVLLEQRTWYTDRTYAYAMPPERSFDIDEEWEFRLVDLFLKDKQA